MTNSHFVQPNVTIPVISEPEDNMTRKSGNSARSSVSNRKLHTL